MQKKLNTFFLFLIFSILLASCQKERWYKKSFNEQERAELAQSLLAGVAFYYQGTVPEQFLVEEALHYDSTNADTWRELGTAQVKRGFATNMQYYYGEAVKHNPLAWQGWRGYLYLYFYRDYESAIADFNAVDSLLGEVGHSQGQNHDYMRGLAYYGLKNYTLALHYLNKYINSTISQQSLDWVDPYAILYRGLTYLKMNKPTKATADFNLALSVYPKLADAHFHKAMALFKQDKKEEAIQALYLAKENFNLGYSHQRPYIEVLNQLFAEDIEKKIDMLKDLQN